MHAVRSGYAAIDDEADQRRTREDREHLHQLDPDHCCKESSHRSEQRQQTMKHAAVQRLASKFLF
jgi:hypothetical protein